MPWTNKDITVVSWGRFLECNPCDHIHRRFAMEHVRRLLNYEIPFQFIDYGSMPHFDTAFIKFVDGDSNSEAAAKNHGLLMVDTPLVAFTDWRALISLQTISRTIEHLNQEGVPEHFIMQAFPWEISNFHKRRIIEGIDPTQDAIDMIENMAIPHSAPKLPSGAWQVCLTEDAAAIRGWNEDVQDLPAADFHERMRAYCGWINGDNRGEILTRMVPVVVADFNEPSAYAQDQQISPALRKFVAEADPDALGWRDPV